MSASASTGLIDGLIDGLVEGIDGLDHLAEAPRGALLDLGRLVREGRFRISSHDIDEQSFQNYVRLIDYETNFPDYFSTMPENILRAKKMEHYLSFEITQPKANDIVIDVACASSPVDIILEQHYGVKHAWRQDLTDWGRRCIVGDAASMGLPRASVDILMLHNAWEHFQPDSDVRFLMEAERLLRPGGQLLIIPLKASATAHVMTDPSVWPTKQVMRQGTKPLFRKGVPVIPSPCGQTYDQFFDARMLIAFARLTPALEHELIVIWRRDENDQRQIHDIALRATRR